MPGDPEEEEIQEFEISIEPFEDELFKLGIDRQAFDSALFEAIEKHHALVLDEKRSEEEIPPLGEMELVFGGVIFKLGALANVEIRGIDR